MGFRLWVLEPENEDMRSLQPLDPHVSASCRETPKPEPQRPRSL